MTAIWALALQTVREVVRERVLYNLIFFAILLIGASIVLSHLTIGEAGRVMVDVGLASLNLFGVAVAVFVGISLVHREIDRRTIYFILAKPISRPTLVAGKYLGFCVVLMLNLGLMAAWYLGLLWLTDVPVTPNVLQALYTILLECLVLAAIAVVFSTVTTPTLGTMCTLSLYVVGHSASTLAAVAQRVCSPFEPGLEAVLYLFPHLELFNLKSAVFAEHSMPGEQLAWLTLYALTYSLSLLAFAGSIFRRRDLA